MVLNYLDTIIAFVVILLGVSLLITILNQMISALLGYRGTNLLWGVQNLLSTVEPELAEQSKGLAIKLLKKPIISDSIFSKFEESSLLGRISTRWRLATALSKEDLIRGLRNLADGVETNDNEANLIHNLLAAADPELQNKVTIVQNVLSGLSPTYSLQVDKMVQQLGTSVQTSVGQVEAWFDVVMKRASQRFTLQMRIWTIIFAFLIAFGTHMDSFKIVQQLWTSPGQRSALVSEKEGILEEAAVVLSYKDGSVRSGVSGVSPQILVDAMNKFRDSEKDATAGLSAVPRFNSLDEAVQWLHDGLKVDENSKKILIGKYNNLVLSELTEHANRITQKLNKAGFMLQLPPLKKLICYDDLSNVLGILVSAAFLSLGAPFWFNALKALSNLRPMIATQQGEKQ